MTEFVEFQKIPRLSREMIITEKIDGTNGQILIEDDFTTIQVGSRTRWLSEKEDNHGFYKWVISHKDEILTLGPGRHFGEWWGQGINRGYDLKEKRFSLFNTTRWNSENTPPCVSVVPVLYRGLFDTDQVQQSLNVLALSGSVASPGFKNPEGVVIYHVQGGIFFKKTIVKDDEWKGKS